MIPTKLIVEGLYSYRERQEIDFRNLTSAGLFGIFGDTGSGKSSILEAITYALYGETERLNQRENRAYNMMNLRSDKTHIEFEFYNHAHQLFRVTREEKRNSRHFEKTSNSVVSFYEQINGQWIPVEKNGEQILGGLSYKNFKRTIIIPQGQFREFIELKDKDRTQMLKEIFRLDRFDLSDKAGKLERDTKTKLDEINGRLQGYEEITSEAIEKKKDDLEKAAAEQKIIQRDHEARQTEYNRLKSVREDFILLAGKKQALGKKEQDLIRIEKLREKIGAYEKISSTFSSLLKERDKQTAELAEIRKKEEEKEKDLKTVSGSLDLQIKALEDLTPAYNNLDTETKKVSDLEFIKNIHTAGKSVDVLGKNISDGKSQMENVKDQISQINEKIKITNEEIGNLTGKTLDAALLLNAGNWFNNLKNLQNLFDTQQKKVQSAEKNLANEQQKLIAKNVTSENYLTVYDEKISQEDKEITEIEKQKNQWEVQQKLSEYAIALHDGEPCPLCGSKDHPDILQANDFSRELKRIQEKFNNSKKKRDYLLQEKKVIENILGSIKKAEEDLSKEKKTEAAARESLARHHEAFSWPEFDKSNEAAFEEKKKSSVKAETLIKNKNESLKNLNLTRDGLQTKATALSEKIKEYEIQCQQKIAEADTNKRNLKVLHAEDYEQFSVSEIEREEQATEAKITETKTKYAALNNGVNDLNLRLAKIKTFQESLGLQKKNLENNLRESQSEIDTKLAAEKLEIDAVKNIINQNIDVQKERERINAFTIQFETLKNSIHELEERLKNIEFSEEHFKNAENEFTTLAQALAEKNKTVIEHRTLLKRLMDDFKIKTELLSGQEKLQSRAANLSIMVNLFRGAGFVNYVSSIYLRQLCNQANQRFQRMTRNQLSLQVDENNNFIVMDFLNEGHTRSVKTLSGGQMFQVSLSLALALAESVQAGNKDDRNFFFIDEGFGTQDAESVNIVFDTLLDLNRQNKIVGIISHVEELKDKMPVALKIVKDKERGSLIIKDF